MPAKLLTQFEKPQGLLGRLVGQVLAHRSSNRKRNLWTVELLDLRPDHRLLELGCGPGYALKACADRVVAGHLTGVDHSDVMIAQAGRRLRVEIREKRVDLQVGSLEILQQFTGRLDRVYSVNVIQFLPDKEAAYRVIYGSLVPGGVVATTYEPRQNNPTREDALRMAEEVTRSMGAVGFKELRTEELPLKPVCAICVLGRRAS
jgi:trans-aconitate methyltransferase